MELNLLSIFILIILVVCIIEAVKVFASQKGFTWRTFLNFLAGFCLIIGTVGFLGTIFFSTTDLELPQSFEWPVGDSDAALKYSDGHLVVPHEPSGRVQVYDQSFQFIRGWSVNSGGGSFQLFPVDKSTFYVFTARSNMQYHYDLEGNLLSSKKHSGSYPQNNSQLVSVTIPTPFYLQVFTHPFASWLFAAFGMFLLFVTGEAFRKKPEK